MNNNPNEPKLLDHDADGIRELDNNLPRWWVWLFYLCILYAAGYLCYYHVFNMGDLQAAEYAKEHAIGEKIKTEAIGKFESDGPTWLAGFRQMVEMTSGPPQRQILATRGERLALARVLWRGADGDIGLSEVEWLLIIEVDEQGAHRAVVSLDPKDLDAGYDEIQARYEAGEAAPHGPVFDPPRA